MVIKDPQDYRYEPKRPGTKQRKKHAQYVAMIGGHGAVLHLASGDRAADKDSVP